MAAKKSRFPAQPTVPVADDPAALGGYDVLIADRGNNRLLLVSPQKQILWQYDFQGLPHADGADDAFFVQGGKSVIVNLEHDQVIEIIDRASKAVTWSYGTLGWRGHQQGLLDFPDDAYKLPNGCHICRYPQLPDSRDRARQVDRAPGGSHAPLRLRAGRVRRAQRRHPLAEECIGWLAPMCQAGVLASSSSSR